MSAKLPAPVPVWEQPDAFSRTLAQRIACSAVLSVNGTCQFAANRMIDDQRITVKKAQGASGPFLPHIAGRIPEALLEALAEQLAVGVAVPVAQLGNGQIGQQQIVVDL